jgi:flagellar biosynthetic protein FlhB
LGEDLAENKEGQEKTEQATAKRLSDARDKGQVAKSVDITTAAIIIFGCLSVYFFGSNIIDGVGGLMTTILSNLDAISLTDQNAESILFQMLTFGARLVLPIIIIIFALAIIGEVSQVGFKVAGKKFTEGAKWDQVFNPFKNLKRVFFSSNTAYELAKNFFKLALLALVVYSVVAGKNVEIMTLMEKPFGELATFMSALAFELVMKMGILYIVIAIIDFYYQKWKFAQDMKMTKNEMKDEHKQMEGDPMVKNRMRAMMRGRLRNLMMNNVPEADVIITNPEHYAVAIKYKPGQMSAPIVVAKGVDFLAQKIKQVARDNDVPIVENPPIARAIYAACEVDQEIPAELFKTVAEILVYVYSLTGKEFGA